ncbi:non-ribosomal peptide synthetase [Micromonospora sp. WMMD975]|uniref:non-ribosomal peptide synthetase n=1 Tax=Micromonospora sp. WMMD975 TaxID=3016087 RepID=UPI002499E913|nr:non-ribosomal peptide synthetase [Micromonospora sp. WMMD975]WFE32726.1 amino acid adenylation domain-containing protein [Micromonospora sp. WMMD975]
MTRSMTTPTPAELIADLRDLGMQLWADDGQLRFRAPKGVLTPERRELLTANREAVLACLDAETTTVTPDPEHEHDPFPLTDVQLAYLLGRRDAFDYGDVPCQVYAEMEYPSLDAERLEEAWNLLVRRHGMLRAGFDLDGHQQVRPEVPRYRIAVTDLRGAAAEEVRAALRATREELDHRAYGPREWPLFELRLTHTDEGTILHVSVDFLIADYLSIQVLLDELHQAYDGVQLPELEVTFRDYLLAERGSREGSRYERDRAYWLDRLPELPGAPELPVRQNGDADQARHPDRRTPGRSRPGRFRRLASTVPAQRWTALQQAAREQRLTPSTAVLAAVAEVIGRWSRNPRFCLNLTLLNREPVHPQIGRLVGDFTTVSLLAVDTAPELGFAERARAVQDRLWADMDHRQFSGVSVMRELARERGRSAALMPVVFTSTLGLGEESEPEPATGLGGTVGYGRSQTPQVWIDAQALVERGALTVRWDVREGIFPDGMVDDMFGELSTLLHRLATEPECWQLPSPIDLPPAQHRARAAANDTAGPLPEGLLTDDVVAAALRYPDRVAVTGPGGSMTYRELLGRASGVAAALRSDGCQPGEIVALAMEKGWEQVVGVLGVLLAGAAYLPLDANQPPARRDRILADAGARRVLGQSWSPLPPPPGTLFVDTLDDPGPADAPDPGRHPDDLAYVIYTSGSTGTPKGVMISHRAALNTIQDVNRRFGVTADDRVLALAGLGFDLSVYDLFGLLGLGGQLVMPAADRRGDPAHWAELLAEHRVTVWNSVPAQLQLLADYLAVEPRADLDALRLALLSGDWIPVGLPDRVRELLPGLRMVSLGGATEAAIWSIFHPIDAVDPGWRSIPYGRPLTNQSFHVLDRWQRPSPDHVPGELHIGGAGLALGYLGDPERTAERFVDHPRHGRLYRTGDVGTYHPDGALEFLGREDRQVKIRGHRIELAEVEAALATAEGVAAAHVLVDGADATRRRLVAFVQTAAGVADRPDDERHRLLAAATSAGEATTDAVDAAELAEFMRRLDRAGLLGMLRALAEQGLFSSPEETHDTAEVLDRSGTAPRHHRLVRRWLNALVRAGLLTERDGRYAAPRRIGPGDLSDAWAAVDELQREDQYPAKLIDYFRTSTESLPRLLRDELDPLPLLFPEGRLDISYAAYRDNVISRYVNHGVVGLLRELAGTRPETLRVLEVGAGVGGTSTVLIPALADADVDYLFTDVSQFFLTEAQQRFGDRASYGLLDINTDPRSQGYLPNSFDVVLCANVLHNSRDAAVVLGRLRELLAPGGWLVFIETTRENVQIMTSMEFMMPEKDPAKWDYDDLRRGRDQTFLDVAQWRGLLTDAGADVLLDLPGAGDVTEPLGQHVIAARFKADRADVRPAGLLRHCAQRVPEYMLPAQVQVVDALPLTGNGKVDPAALAGWVIREGAAAQPADAAPTDELEQRIAAVWADLLQVPRVGREQDFYQLGGDSLLTARLAGRLREEVPEAGEVPYDTLLRVVLNRPTVAALAERLRAGQHRVDDPSAPAERSSPLLPLVDADGDAVRVLVHDGVGTLAAYRNLVPLLGDAGPVVGLAVTGDDPYQDEDPAGLVERRAGDYTRRLLETGATRFDVVGYCMGGLLALEVARQLTESGATVASLTIISSYSLPHTIEDELVLEYVFARLLHLDTEALGYPDDETTARAFQEVLARTPGRVPVGALDGLADDPALAGAAAQFAALRRTPQPNRLAAVEKLLAGQSEEAAVPVELGGLYDLYRHSMRAVTRHEATPYAGDITFLRELEDTGFLPWLRRDMTDYWRDVCLGDLSVVDVPGDHFSCLRPPHVRRVADVLAEVHRGAR